MKFLILLVSLCALVVLVRGESCSNPGACSQTTCDSSSKMACISGICTCVSAVGCSQTSCGDRSQCSSCTCDHHHSSSHHTSEHHCYDGHCVCTTGHSFFPGK